MESTRNSLSMEEPRKTDRSMYGGFFNLGIFVRFLYSEKDLCQKQKQMVLVKVSKED